MRLVAWLDADADKVYECERQKKTEKRQKKLNRCLIWELPHVCVCSLCWYGRQQYHHCSRRYTAVLMAHPRCSHLNRSRVHWKGGRVNIFQMGLWGKCGLMYLHQNTGAFLWDPRPDSPFSTTAVSSSRFTALSFPSCSSSPVITWTFAFFYTINWIINISYFK